MNERLLRYEKAEIGEKSTLLQQIRVSSHLKESLAQRLEMENKDLEQKNKQLIDELHQVKEQMSAKQIYIAKIEAERTSLFSSINKLVADKDTIEKELIC